MNATARTHRIARAALAGAGLIGAVLVLLMTSANSASAHGFTSVVYANVTSSAANTVTVKLQLEYDLLLVSVATSEKDDAFDAEGQPAWDNADYPGMETAAQDHLGSIQKYVLDRFTIAAYGGTACTGVLEDAPTVKLNNSQQVPYLTVTADFTCPAMGRTEEGHVIGSTLFPNAEQFITEGTKTIVVYDVDGKTGSASLDEQQTTFSTEQAWYERFGEFFRLGAEHLLTGPDHILFLLALIAGSRRLREVVLAATSFTLAHSITFILAALGVVSPPPFVVEPVIAFSIAAVAGWYLFRLIRKRDTADQLIVTSRNHFALDRAGWTRLAIVFGFGLIHGLGFAGALGIHEAFSWQLLGSLLIFNVGIEAVQIGLILVIFPPLMLLRRRAHTTSLWVTGAVTAFVVIVGLIWFVERLLGISDWPSVPGVS